MEKKLLCLFILHILLPSFHLEAFGIHNRFKKMRSENYRRIRNLEACVPFINRAGNYTFTNVAGAEACPVIVIAPPTAVIVFNFEGFQVPCEEGYVAVKDGTETTGSKFPADFEEEYVCRGTSHPDYSPHSPYSPSTFTTQSNAAMLIYKINSGFEGPVGIQFLLDRSPCHKFVIDAEGELDIRTSAEQRVCENLFSSARTIEVLEMEGGERTKRRNFQRQQGEECKNGGNYLEILGGEDIGESNMALYARMCPHAGGVRIDWDGNSPTNPVNVTSSYTLVKLVSSGRSEVKAKIRYRKIN